MLLQPKATIPVARPKITFRMPVNSGLNRYSV